MRSRFSSYIFDLVLILEAFTFQAGYIVQRDLGPICQNQHPLDLIQLLQPPGSREVSPPVLPLIRLEPGNRDFRLFRNMLQQNRLPPVQFRLGVLVQLHLLVRQAGRLRDGPCVAGEGGEGAEDGGPVADGHPGVPLGGGMRKIYDAWRRWDGAGGAYRRMVRSCLMPSNRLIPLPCGGAILQVHPLEDGVLTIPLFDPQHGLLELPLSDVGSFICLLLLLLGGVVGK